MRPQLTEVEARAFEVIKDCIERERRSPALEALAEELGTARSNVAQTVKRLIRKGVLVKGTGKRNIQLAGPIRAYVVPQISVGISAPGPKAAVEELKKRGDWHEGCDLYEISLASPSVVYYGRR